MAESSEGCMTETRTSIYKWVRRDVGRRGGTLGGVGGFALVYSYYPPLPYFYIQGVKGGDLSY